MGCFKDKETPNFGDEDGDRVAQNFGDILGTGTAQILGIYWGLSPKNPHISGMGTGFHLLKCLGMVWGRGNPKYWGFLGRNPRKTPNFGDGDGVTAPKMFGDGLGTGKPQNLGWGRGKESRGFLPP